MEVIVMTLDALLACGPYFGSERTVLGLAFIFLIAKPLAYVAFTYAFRYQVSRPIPLGLGRAVLIAIVRTVIGVVIIGGGALLLASGGDSSVAVGAIYLYVSRPLAWGLVGARMLRLRGGRLAGWIVAGTVMNAGFDLLVFSGWFEDFRWMIVLAGLIAFLVMLHVMGQRDSLRLQFDGFPRCSECGYNLTGNLSGVCSECGTVIDHAGLMGDASVGLDT